MIIKISAENRILIENKWKLFILSTDEILEETPIMKNGGELAKITLNLVGPAYTWSGGRKYQMVREAIDECAASLESTIVRSLISQVSR